MKTLLSRIALILGGVVSAASLALNLARRMDPLTSVYRATLVFLATVVILFLFLQLFSAILVRFVAEQVLQQRAPDKGATTNPVSPERARTERRTPGT